MEYTQNFDLGFTHPIRNHIRQAGYHQLAGAQKTTRPSGGRVRDECEFRAFHQFKDNATRGGGTILPDVLRDVVEILASELCPSKPQAASPISISASRDR